MSKLIHPQFYYKDIIYKDYSAFPSSEGSSVEGASIEGFLSQPFFVERRLRRVFLTSALGALAIFSS